jgi:hypothetical protein
MRARKFVRIGLIGVAAATLFSAAPAALAQSGGSRAGVTTSGACSGTALWKLNVHPDNGQLQVEFEVQHAKPGQSWTVRMADNGTRIFIGTRTANSQREFKVEKLTANRAGSDKVTAKATNNATGQVCNGTATL